MNNLNWCSILQKKALFEFHCLDTAFLHHGILLSHHIASIFLICHLDCNHTTIFLLQVYFKATDPFNERWQSAWIITAFWDVIAFALLCVICYLWAPSQSSQR